MNAAKTKTQPGWNIKILTRLGWAVIAIGAIFLLNWTIRSMAIQSTTEPATAPANTFEADVRQGRICAGQLALAQNFSVFLTNQDKTKFTALGEGESSYLSSFAWSPDGKHLALTGGVAGGTIYLADSTGGPLEILSQPQVGYLADIVWSHNGKQLMTWSIPNTSTVYLMNADGTGFTSRQLHNAMFDELPQFSPGDKNFIFHGISLPSYGMVETTLDGSRTRVISALSDRRSSFAWSPDGSRLAYIEMDQDLGEARLVVEEIDNGNKAVIERWSISKGAFPLAKNLSWPSDGKNLVFQFTDDEPNPDSAIYLIRADGSGMVKLADKAYAPTISADGRCLAYISNDHVFVMDLHSASLASVLMADLPVRQETTLKPVAKLQWSP